MSAVHKAASAALAPISNSRDSVAQMANAWLLGPPVEAVRQPEPYTNYGGALDAAQRVRLLNTGYRELLDADQSTITAKFRIPSRRRAWPGACC